MKPSCPSTVAIPMRAILAATFALGACLTNDIIAQPSPPPDGALRAFEVVRSVLQRRVARNMAILAARVLQHRAHDLECTKCAIRRRRRLRDGVADEPCAQGERRMQ